MSSDDSSFYSKKLGSAMYIHIWLRAVSYGQMNSLHIWLHCDDVIHSVHKQNTLSSCSYGSTLKLTLPMHYW